jgi:5-methylcytosine-specific restriction endonuclease McrA
VVRPDEFISKRVTNTMANTYGISQQLEREIRARDKACVYCGILMKQHPHAMGASGATIEHFNNEGPFEEKYNLAICCRRCNSSKGTMRLSAWFKTPYCRKKKIIEETISTPVKEYMRLEKLR